MYTHKVHFVLGGATKIKLTTFELAGEAEFLFVTAIRKSLRTHLNRFERVKGLGLESLAAIWNAISSTGHTRIRCVYNTYIHTCMYIYKAVHMHTMQ
jgi:hypothetical protein